MLRDCGISWISSLIFLLSNYWLINALNNRKLKIFKNIDEGVLFYSKNLDLLPPKPKSFGYLKQGIQDLANSKSALNPPGDLLC